MQKDQAQKEAAYGKLALAHARVTGRGGDGQEPLPTIHPGMPEWSAWARYFKDHQGFEPIAMMRVRKGMSQLMTVPAQWPDEFDGSFRRTAA